LAKFIQHPCLKKLDSSGHKIQATLKAKDQYGKKADKKEHRSINFSSSWKYAIWEGMKMRNDMAF
jgi:hypothetical protein